MSAVADIAAELETALKTVAGARAYRDPGADVSPPGAVLGPPSLSWESGCPEPTSATFPVYVVVAADEWALERLWDLVPAVAAAIDAVPDAAVTEAVPGTYLVGGTPLPSYDLTVEVSL